MLAHRINENLSASLNTGGDNRGRRYSVAPQLGERAHSISEMHIPSLSASDERVRRFADAQGIPLLLLAPPMGNYAVVHGVAQHGFPATPFNSDAWPYATRSLE